MSSERKNFKKWVTDIVYEKQEGLCIKCGKSLEQGFHKHHKDGDASNNTVENLELLCPNCHATEQFKTLQEQRLKHLNDLDRLIQNAIDNKVSGAVLDKLIEAIKLSLNLESKLYSDVELPPINIRLQYNELIQKQLLEEYIRGYKEGVKKGLDLALIGMTSSVKEQINLDEIEKLIKQLKNTKTYEG